MLNVLLCACSCPAVSGTTVSVSCFSATTYPASFTLTLRATASPASCQTFTTVSTTINTLCCVSGAAYVRGGSSTSTATCLGTRCAIGGWENRFTGPSPPTSYPINFGAGIFTCNNARTVGSIRVGCAAAGTNRATVTFEAPSQVSAAAISARFYLGCTSASCTAAGGSGASVSCTGTSSPCGGTMALATQSYTLPCACSNVRWLYRQSSTGFSGANGACP